ncbi:MAG: hypothetical protein Q8O24_06780 [Gallionellaceae bacterium]|nr:hypothetical protein [Gallionellaceae bacterium]
MNNSLVTLSNGAKASTFKDNYLTEDMMAISNVNNSNSVNSTSRVASTPTVARKTPTQSDSGDGAVVTLSKKAREMSQTQLAMTEQKQSIERFQDLNRNDKVAQEKMDVSAKADEQAIQAKQKIDEQLYKRINTYA